MRKKKLLKQLRNFFDMGKKKRLKHMQELEDIIKEIKNNEKKLIATCRREDLSESESRAIKQEISVLHAKRRKGLKALRALRHSQMN